MDWCQGDEELLAVLLQPDAPIAGAWPAGTWPAGEERLGGGSEGQIPSVCPAVDVEAATSAGVGLAARSGSGRLPGAPGGHVLQRKRAYKLSSIQRNTSRIAEMQQVRNMGRPRHRAAPLHHAAPTLVPTHCHHPLRRRSSRA